MTAEAILEQLEPTSLNGLFFVVTFEAIASTRCMETTSEIFFPSVTVNTQPNVGVVFVARNLVTGQTI